MTAAWEKRGRRNRGRFQFEMTHHDGWGGCGGGGRSGWFLAVVECRQHMTVGDEGAVGLG